MTTLAEIEAAAAALSLEDRNALLHSLAGSDDQEARGTHSVLEIPPISVGNILRPLSADDVLGEMLEGRV